MKSDRFSCAYPHIGTDSVGVMSRWTKPTLNVDPKDDIPTPTVAINVRINLIPVNIRSLPY
ncbi:MAG: hypothetical protein AMXMBFR82_46860 [Candidatus Hydrogenedentota bacterium]